MTISELNQLQYLQDEARGIDREIEELRAICARYDLRGESVNRLRALLYQAKRRAESDALRALAFIDAIPDQYTRRIFYLRFSRGKSWQEISNALDNTISAETLRRTVSRYIRRHGDTERGGAAC